MAANSFFTPQQTLNIKDKLFNLSKPSVMGILNTTPDSFYSDSRIQNIDAALKKTEQFLNEGADFIDVGAYSSRPGSDNITVDEELQRLIPVVEAIAKKFPEAIISVDTFRANVAEESVLAGAHIINDIAAGQFDENMFETVARLQIPYIIMHMHGTPQNMHNNPVYENVLLDVVDYFSKKISALRNLGIKDIIIDLGFGFSKTLAHNYQLLNQLDNFKLFNLPVLVGFSRKSMIWKPLNITPQEALNGTTVLNTIALQKGANILRVHDVKEAKECIDLIEKMKNH